MFKSDLKKKLEAIFGLPVTYDEPSDAYEQKKIFVQVAGATERITQGLATARVEASISVYASSSELPFGFFAKAIQAAKPADTRPFYFFDIDTIVGNSPARLMNIQEVQLRFVYLYSSQYDPNHGTMSEVEWQAQFTLDPLASGDGQVIETGEGHTIGVNK